MFHFYIHAKPFQCIGHETLSNITASITSSAGPCAIHRRDGPASAPADGTTLQAELETVVKTFILPSAPKELNIPSTMRKKCLAGLEASSDPCHLRPLAAHAYQLLRDCSHRNFVRIGVGNATFESLCVGVTIGSLLIATGFVLVLVRGLACPRIGENSRWDVFGAWPVWWLGMSLVLSGTRGSCFFLLLISRRQRLPWERLEDDNEVHSVVTMKKGFLDRVRLLGMFDGSVSLKNADLRRWQRRVELQSALGAAAFASAAVLLFIFLPMWRETIH